MWWNLYFKINYACQWGCLEQILLKKKVKKTRGWEHKIRDDKTISKKNKIKVAYDTK